MCSSQLVGVVCINHRHRYGTRLGIENTKRPELVHHKYCNILFQLNIHDITETNLLQDIQNAALHTERNKAIIIDISSFESILMTLNEAVSFEHNKKDPYLVSCGTTEDYRNENNINKYDSVTPFRKMILNNILTERNIFLDYERSIPASGPIRNLIEIFHPKSIAAIGENQCFINEVTDDKFVSVLFDGPTLKIFPLQLPIKRCFFADDGFIGPSKVFMVIAPYSESLVPVTSNHSNLKNVIFEEIGLSKMTFNVNEMRKSQIVQYPSYAISYMIVPCYWNEETVLHETYNRCKHYTHSSNLNLEVHREFATICLGDLKETASLTNLSSISLHGIELYQFENFEFRVGDWHYSTGIYKRDLSNHRGLMLSAEKIDQKSIIKNIPITSLPARLFLSQMPRFEKLTTENDSIITHWIYNKVLNKKLTDPNKTQLDQKLIPLYENYFENLPSKRENSAFKITDLHLLVNKIKNYHTSYFTDHSPQVKHSEEANDILYYRPQYYESAEEIELWEKWTRNYPSQFKKFMEVMNEMNALQATLEGVHFDNNSLLEQINTLKTEYSEIKESFHEQVSDIGNDVDAPNKNALIIANKRKSLSSLDEEISKLESIYEDNIKYTDRSSKKMDLVGRKKGEFIRNIDAYISKELESRKRNLIAREQENHGEQEEEKKKKKKKRDKPKVDSN